MNTPAVVMDNGTGLTKWDLPETILLHLFSQQQLQLPASSKAGKGARGSSLASKRGLEDLDFYIGDEALEAASGSQYGLHYQSSTDKLKIGIKWNGFGKVQFSSI